MWKFLIVDDNANNRELLLATLEELAQCDVSCDGQEALSFYQRSVSENWSYDAIFLDIAMPGIDGMEVLKTIRDSETSRNIEGEKRVPVFMVTAHKEPFTCVFNSGCDDYILKPLEPDKVVSRVKDRLENR